MTPAPAAIELPPRLWRRLDNGLRLLILVGRRRPLVSLRLLVRAGSALDPAGAEGCASLAASLLIQGSRLRDADALAGALADTGAGLSVGTGHDAVHLEMTGLSTSFPAMLRLLAEVALSPAFAAGPFGEMRARRLHSLARALDDPATVADRAFARELRPAHPYARPPHGLAATVSALGPKDVAAFHASRYSPAGALLAIAGDVDPEPAADAAAEVFGSWLGEPAPGVPACGACPPSSRVIAVHRPGLSQAHIRWGHEGPARSAPDAETARVMNDPLAGGGFSSRLMQRVRSEKGLVYGIHGSFDGQVAGGSFRIAAATPTASAAAVIGDIDTLVREYRDRGPTPAEAQAARARLSGGYRLQVETPAQAASRLLDAAFHGLPEEHVSQAPARIAALADADLASCAARLLHPERPLVVVAADFDQMPADALPPGPMERLEAGTLFSG